MIDKLLPPIRNRKCPILHQGDIPVFYKTYWNLKHFVEVKKKRSYPIIIQLSGHLRYSRKSALV